nr:PREDICTED: RAD51-associated protein 2 [Latimeria chalumnae]|eukprot:XP_014344810.1 PREDICTED: RAD51-associated protein 2 [Latimeria chalumnae]
MNCKYFRMEDTSTQHDMACPSPKRSRTDCISREPQMEQLELCTHNELIQLSLRKSLECLPEESKVLKEYRTNTTVLISQASDDNIQTAEEECANSNIIFESVPASIEQERKNKGIAESEDTLDVGEINKKVNSKGHSSSASDGTGIKSLGSVSNTLVSVSVTGISYIEKVSQGKIVTEVCKKEVLTTTVEYKWEAENNLHKIKENMKTKDEHCFNVYDQPENKEYELGETVPHFEILCKAKETIVEHTAYVNDKLLKNEIVAKTQGMDTIEGTHSTGMENVVEYADVGKSFETLHNEEIFSGCTNSFSNCLKNTEVSKTNKEKTITILHSIPCLSENETYQSSTICCLGESVPNSLDQLQLTQTENTCCSKDVPDVRKQIMEDEVSALNPANCSSSLIYTVGNHLSSNKNKEEIPEIEVKEDTTTSFCYYRNVDVMYRDEFRTKNCFNDKVTMVDVKKQEAENYLNIPTVTNICEIINDECSNIVYFHKTANNLGSKEESLIPLKDRKKEESSCFIFKQLEVKRPGKNEQKDILNIDVNNKNSCLIKSSGNTESHIEMEEDMKLTRVCIQPNIEKTAGQSCGKELPLRSLYSTEMNQLSLPPVIEVNTSHKFHLRNHASQSGELICDLISPLENISEKDATSDTASKNVAMEDCTNLSIVQDGSEIKQERETNGEAHGNTITIINATHLVKSEKPPFVHLSHDVTKCEDSPAETTYLFSEYPKNCKRNNAQKGIYNKSRNTHTNSQKSFVSLVNTYTKIPLSCDSVELERVTHVCESNPSSLEEWVDTNYKDKNNATRQNIFSNDTNKSNTALLSFTLSDTYVSSNETNKVQDGQGSESSYDTEVECIKHSQHLEKKIIPESITIHQCRNEYKNESQGLKKEVYKNSVISDMCNVDTDDEVNRDANVSKETSEYTASAFYQTLETEPVLFQALSDKVMIHNSDVFPCKQTSKPIITNDLEKSNEAPNYIVIKNVCDNSDKMEEIINLQSNCKPNIEKLNSCLKENTDTFKQSYMSLGLKKEDNLLPMHVRDIHVQEKLTVENNSNKATKAPCVWSYISLQQRADVSTDANTFEDQTAHAYIPQTEAGRGQDVEKQCLDAEPVNLLKFEMKEEFDLVLQELCLFHEISKESEEHPVNKEAFCKKYVENPELQKADNLNYILTASAQGLEDKKSCSQNIISDFGKVQSTTTVQSIMQKSQVAVISRQCSRKGEQEVPVEGGSSDTEGEELMYSSQNIRDYKESNYRTTICWNPAFMDKRLTSLQMGSGLHQSGGILRVEPLKTCTGPIRLGLSKRAKPKHLHPYLG